MGNGMKIVCAMRFCGSFHTILLNVFHRALFSTAEYNVILNYHNVQSFKQWMKKDKFLSNFYFFLKRKMLGFNECVT